MASINLNVIGTQYECATRDIYGELKKKIDDNYGRCFKLIGRAKWRQKFSSGRKLSDRFGRWNR